MIEKEEWKQKSKKLAATFLETLRGLKENLFAVRDESMNELAVAKEHYEARIHYIAQLVDSTRAENQNQ